MFNLFKTSHLYRNTEDEWNCFRSGPDATIYYNPNHIDINNDKHIARVFVKYYTNNGPQMKIYLDPEHAQRTMFASMLINIDKKLCRIEEGFLQGADHTYFSEKDIPWRPILYVEEPLFVYCRNLMTDGFMIPAENTTWTPFLESNGETSQFAIFESSNPAFSHFIIIQIQNKFQPIQRYVAFSLVVPPCIQPDSFQLAPYAETAIKNNKCTSTFCTDDYDDCKTYAQNNPTFPLITLNTVDELESLKSQINHLLFELFSKKLITF